MPPVRKRKERAEPEAVEAWLANHLVRPFAAVRLVVGPAVPVGSRPGRGLRAGGIAAGPSPGRRRGVGSVRVDGHRPVRRRPRRHDEGVPVQILDPHVSRKHFQILFKPETGLYYVLDMRSRHGTLVGGEANELAQA
mgnify:CR=1 FL=1